MIIMLKLRLTKKWNSTLIHQPKIKQVSEVVVLEVHHLHLRKPTILPSAQLPPPPVVLIRPVDPEPEVSLLLEAAIKERIMKETHKIAQMVEALLHPPPTRGFGRYFIFPSHHLIADRPRVSQLNTNFVDNPIFIFCFSWWTLTQTQNE